MLAITGWISLALLSGPAQGEPAGNITVEVRVMEMKGISWRGAAYHELTPQGRQGAAAVWTAGPAGLKTLSAQATQVIQCPRVVTAEGSSSQIRNETQHNYVAHLKRVADGPPGESTKVAYEPLVAAVSDGVAAEFSCRAVAGGTMVRTTVDDAHLVGFHTFTFQDSVNDPKTRKTSSIVNPQVQVPELTTCHVSGEWLVPPGGVLIVGLGAKSTPADKSHSGVRERVVVIEPKLLNMQDAELARVVVAGPGFPIRFEPTPLKTADDRVQTARFTRPKPVAAKTAPAARPMAISPTVLPLLASPTIAPRARWKASVRIEARMTPPAATSDESVTLMCLPLSAAPLPIGLSNVWLAVSVEPRRDAAGMRMATPPSRGLPTPITVNGEVVDLPPLPDSALELASSLSTAEAKPSPQVQPAPAERRLDARLARVVGQLIADRHAVLNQLACDEVVIYPVPHPMQEFAQKRRVAENVGCSIIPGRALDAAEVSAAHARLQRLRFESEGIVLDAAPSTKMTIDANFLPAYFTGLFRGTDGTPVEIEGPPIYLDIPTVTASPADIAPGTIDAAIASALRSGQFTRCVFPTEGKAIVVTQDRPRFKPFGNLTHIQPGRTLDANALRTYYGQVLRAEDATPTGNLAANPFLINPIRDHTAGNKAPLIIGAAGTSGNTKPGNFEAILQHPINPANADFIPPVSHPAVTTTEPKTVRGSTLGLSLKGADGACEYDSGISLKSIEAQPVTVRVPMADGTIVEIQARVVKPAKK